MIKNKFVAAPLVLGAICVVAAGMVGGVHYLAETYGPKVDPNVAPDEIKALYKDDSSVSFKTVENFEPHSYMESSYKVTIDSAYQVIRGGAKVGYAYMVSSGKPVKTQVLLSVSFEGDISADTKESVSPAKLNVYQAGDDGYDTKAMAYANGVMAGTYDIDTSDGLVTGGTKSATAIKDGCLAAREQYVSDWTGAGPITDTRDAYCVKIFGSDNVKATEDDSSFTPIAVSYTLPANSFITGKGSVSKRVKVTLMDGSIAYAYEGTASGRVTEYEDLTGTIDIYFGYQGAVTEGNAAAVMPMGYAVVDSSMSKDQWETTYLAGIANGSFNVSEISNGATFTSGLLRSMINAERKDYYATKLAEQKANVAATFQGMYADYQSYAAVDGFEAVSFSSDDGSGTASALYQITRAAGTSYVYYASGNIKFDTGEEQEDCSFAFYVGWSNATSPDCYVVDQNGFTFSQWKEGYFDKALAGSEGLDAASVNCGATHSATIIRKMLLAERTDVAARLGK